MKKYPVKCHKVGCGRVVGSLELPDDQPLTDQAQGYWCEACSKSLSANIGSREPAPEGVVGAQRAALEVFKAKVGGKKTVSPGDLDELIGILFRK